MADNLVSKFTVNSQGTDIEVKIKDADARNLIAQEITDRDNAVTQLQNSINALTTARNNLIRLDSDGNTEIPTVNNVEITAGKDLVTNVSGNKRETVADTKTLTTKQLIIKSTNPVQYNTPTDYNDYFDSIEMQGADGNTYNVLVANENTNNISSLYVASKEGFQTGDYDNATALTNFITKLNNERATLFIDKGIYQFYTDATVPASINLVFVGGAVSIADEHTLTFNGQIIAPKQQVFYGGGTYAFNRTLNYVGYPEWFGAAPDVSTVDSIDAIQKCVNYFQKTMLSKGTYYISKAISITSDSKEIIGIQDWSNYWNNSNFMITDPNSGAVEVVGTTSSLVDKVVLKNFSCRYSSTVNEYVRCVSAQYVSHLYIEHLSFLNCNDCIFISQSIVTHVRDCTTVYNNDFPSTQSAIGYHFGAGVTSELGYAGANASLYCDNCNTSGETSLNLTGMLIHGAVSDHYITNYECGNTPYCIRIESSSLGTSTQYYNNIYINHAILDNFTNGISCSNLGDSCTININNCYFAPKIGATDVTPSLTMTECKGCINISNCFFLQNYAQPTSDIYTAIRLNASKNIITKGNMFSECFRCYLLTGCDNVFLNDIVNNAVITGVNVARLEGCNHVAVKPVIGGKTNAYNYNLVSTINSTYIELDNTSIQSDIQVNSSTAGMLSDGDTPITTVGTTGSFKLDGFQY